MVGWVSIPVVNSYAKAILEVIPYLPPFKKLPPPLGTPLLDTTSSRKSNRKEEITPVLQAFLFELPPQFFFFCKRKFS